MKPTLITKIVLLLNKVLTHYHNEHQSSIKKICASSQILSVRINLRKLKIYTEVYNFAYKHLSLVLVCHFSKGTCAK